MLDAAVTSIKTRLQEDDTFRQAWLLTELILKSDCVFYN
jgi:hypothetical protein